MQKCRIMGTIWVLFCALTSVRAQDSYEARAKKYVEQYKDMAIAEQKRSGVPAAITLAQGIHETNAGNSELVLNANNHFGIKCKKEWTGLTYTYTDDAPDECFRRYNEAAQSYRDHSDYLKTAPRYAPLFKLAATDYEGWANGLRKCGYATNPQYARILIKLVQDYRLQVYTFAALREDNGSISDMADLQKKESQTEIIPAQDAKQVATAAADASITAGAYKKNKIMISYPDTLKNKIKKEENEELMPASAAPVYGELVKVNGLKAFYAKKGSVLLNEAMTNGLRYPKLLELNDLPDAPLEADMYVYLERKHTAGSNATHVVQQGETLTQIAQKEGLQLKYLKAYNKIGGNEEPVEGAMLQLQHYSETRPATFAKAVLPAESKPLVNVKTSANPYITKKEIAKQSTGEDRISKEEMKPLRHRGEAESVKTEAAPAAIPSVARVENNVVIDSAAFTESAPPASQEPVAAAGPSDKIETPVAGTKSTPRKPVPAEPADEFSRLKAKLDQVVYASDAASDDLKDTAAAPAKPADAPAAAPVSGKAKLYTVKKGDTAFSIAKKHHITMRQLMTWNSLDFNAVKLGQQLRVNP